MKHKSLLSMLMALVLQFCFAATIFAQDVTVTGTVTDADYNEPLIGVSVVLQGNAKVGTVTDIDGNYSITVPAHSALQFSYIGYQPTVVNVNGQKTVNVTLSPESNTLEEVVAIGYGTQKKADLTGAVAVVDMKEVKKSASTNIYEMLQGQVAGVSVSTTSQPGAMSTVQIRGTGSFNSVGPLYVLDGLVVNDVNHLNPNEIESMQVLKDASAAAIYGARGANGVILINTKKGKKGQPTLDISATWSIADMPKTIEMKSGEEFMHYNEQAYLNAGVTWPAHNFAIENIGKYIPNTDWQKAVLQKGFTQDYNVMYSQGSDNVNMAIGAGYMDQEGVFEGPNYQRFTARMNTDATYNISDNVVLKIGENATFQHTVNHVTNGGSFANALSMPPVIPVYDPDEPAQHKGDPGFGYGSATFPTYSTNPVANILSDEGLSVNNRVIANAFVELTFFKKLTYKFNGGIDAWFGRNKWKNHCYTMRMGSGEQRYDDVLTDNRDQRITTVIDNTLTYNDNFNGHGVSVMVGHSAEDVNWHWLEAQGYDQKIEGIWQIGQVGTMNRMSGSNQSRRTLSYFGRLDYNYNDRYLFQMNIRSDGSSKFGPNKRRGTFPSFSAGWRVSEEKFWEPLKDVVDNLKLRASWGKVGDMQSLGNYGWIPTIDHTGPYEGLYFITGPAGNETIHYGATQATRVNTNLGWETKTTTNVGVDFNMFQSRLFGSFEWFYSKSTDLLVNLPIAWGTGILSGVEMTNYGEMRNSGIEASLGWRDKKGDFEYSVSANIATIRNKVLRMGDSYNQQAYTRSEVGRSISDFYLLQAAGIFQSMDEVYEYTHTADDGTVTVIQPNAQPGDVKYLDVNNDGKIDDNDKDWSGSPLPKFELGLNASVSWKGFDFNMLWAGKFGHKIYNEVRANTLAFNVDNIPADVNPWTWDNPSNTYPRMYASSTDNNKASSRHLENGTYFRLKNVQLGYTLPQTLTRKIYLQKVRAYVSGTNLLTLTGYKGYDPDIISSGVYTQGIDTGQYPSTRQVNFGLQVTF